MYKGFKFASSLALFLISPSKASNEVEKPPQPDLTGDTEGLKLIGWGVPTECNEFVVGSVMSVFCPSTDTGKAPNTADLRHILHT